MAIVLSMSVIVKPFGAPIDAPLTILIVATAVSCIALVFLWLRERSGGLDKTVCTIVFYAIVATYVIASAIAMGIMVYSMPKPIV